VAQTERKHALPQGTVLRDSYRIESVLGAGGFAITYLGSHTGLDQKVAIKEYMPDQFAVREADRATVRPRADAGDDYKHGLRRFAEEARTLAKFKHPGIVPVTDIFEENGTAYMVMEYVEGESLHQRLARAGTLDEAAFRATFDPILGALAEVHSNGILHRDIKPANIYLRADGSPVLLDFGNSREALGTKARSLTVALTPGYAPSEQYSSRGKQGPWTDIYSLGATMYASITGIDPPEAPDRALDDEYVPAGEADKRMKSDFSASLLQAIDRALAVRPENRPQNIGDFRLMIDGRAGLESTPSAPQTILPGTDQARSGAAAIPVPAGRPATLSRAGGRRWRPIAIAAALVVVLAGGGAFGWMKYQEAKAERLAAAAERKAQIAVANARAAAMGRREFARFERAAELEEERAVAAARRAAWLRRVREQREAEEEARRTEEKRKTQTNQGQGGLIGGVKNFFEKILPGSGR
jgi:tRNA A-37 threonylcarbamoyl transferase component Bud32